jgi:lipid II:glycine glycyltransferase (peptidoglycan interpeptide bridge formation enzyme)
MLLNILPYDENIKSDTSGISTFADNICLPKILAKTFGWEAVSLEYTYNQKETTYIGACRIGKRIVLLPHFSYGPYSAPESVKAIFHELSSQGYTCEWRLFEKASEFVFTSKVTTLLPLFPDSEEQYRRFDSNVKRKIRKCALNGIIVNSGKVELLHHFYEIYSRNMHRLGSPALPERWFRHLLTDYRDGEAGIWIASFDEKPVGAAFMLEYQGFYEACWVSTLNEYNRLYTSYGLYWEMIRFAVEQEGRNFSFGRSSTGSGVHRFKKQWGGEDLTLYWNYSHPQKRNVRKLTFLPKLWKLLPYRLAKIIGPLIAGKFY